MTFYMPIVPFYIEILKMIHSNISKPIKKSIDFENPKKCKYSFNYSTYWRLRNKLSQNLSYHFFYQIVKNFLTYTKRKSWPISLKKFFSPYSIFQFKFEYQKKYWFWCTLNFQYQNLKSIVPHHTIHYLRSLILILEKKQKIGD